MLQKKTHYSLIMLGLVSALALSACATTGQLTYGEFGQATAHNRAVQEVLPTEQQKTNTYIPSDSVRQAAAREAYREGKVKKPKPISTK